MVNSTVRSGIDAVPHNGDKLGYSNTLLQYEHNYLAKDGSDRLGNYLDGRSLVACGKSTPNDLVASGVAVPCQVEDRHMMAFSDAGPRCEDRVELGSLIRSRKVELRGRLRDRPGRTITSAGATPPEGRASRQADECLWVEVSSGQSRSGQAETESCGRRGDAGFEALGLA